MLWHIYAPCAVFYILFANLMDGIVPDFDELADDYDLDLETWFQNLEDEIAYIESEFEYLKHFSDIPVPNKKRLDHLCMIRDAYLEWCEPLAEWV